MRQRGFATEYLIIGIAGLAILTALFFGIKGYLAHVEQSGYDRAEADYAKRDNEALKAAIAAKKASDDRIAELEKNAAKSLAQLDADYQKDLADEANRNRDVLESARNGTLVLRDPGAVSPAAGDRDATGKVAACASGGNGEAGGQLSGKADEFLLSEAQRANAIVHQLSLAQAVIEEDRKICSGAN